MKLHFSWTVLAAVIWIILVLSSAHETIIKGRREALANRGENSNAKDKNSRNRSNWWRETRAARFVNGGPSGSKSFGSSTYPRAIETQSDMVQDAVEKRHVREFELSKETTGTAETLPSNIVENEAHIETVEASGHDNDHENVFLRQPRASFDSESSKNNNIIVPRDTADWDASSLKIAAVGSNDRRRKARMETPRKNDSISHESTKNVESKVTPARFPKVFNISGSSVTNKNPWELISENSNITVKSRIYERESLTNETALKNIDSREGKKFRIDSSMQANQETINEARSVSEVIQKILHEKNQRITKNVSTKEPTSLRATSDLRITEFFKQTTNPTGQTNHPADNPARVGRTILRVHTTNGTSAKEASDESRRQIPGPPRARQRETSVAPVSADEVYEHSSATRYPLTASPAVSRMDEHLKIPQNSAERIHESQQHQKWKKQKNNYLRSEGAEGRSYRGSLFNNDPSGAEENEDSRDGQTALKVKEVVSGFGGRNNEAASSLKIAPSVDSHVSSNNRNIIDDASSSCCNGEIREKVVRTAVSRMNLQDHKTLIEQKSDRKKDLPSRRLAEKRTKHSEKFSSNMGVMETNGAHDQKDKTSYYLRALGNSGLTSPWSKRANNLFSTATNSGPSDGKRKMEYRVTEESAEESAKIEKSTDVNADSDDATTQRAIFAEGSDEVFPRLMQFSRVSGTESNVTSGDELPENRRNFIENIYQATTNSHTPNDRLRDFHSRDDRKDDEKVAVIRNREKTENIARIRDPSVLPKNATFWPHDTADNNVTDFPDFYHSTIQRPIEYSRKKNYFFPGKTDKNSNVSRANHENLQDTNAAISNNESCITCGSTSTVFRNDPKNKYISGDPEESTNRAGINDITKKIDQSIRNTVPSKSSLATESPELNKISVNLNLGFGRGNSLENTSAVLFDDSIPEARSLPETRPINGRILVRDREAISNAAEQRDSIVSKERISALRLPTGSNEKLSVEKKVTAAEKKIDNSDQSSGVSGRKLELRELELHSAGEPMKNLGKHGNNISRFALALADVRKAQFSDKSNVTFEDSKSSRLTGTSRTESEARPLKSVVQNDNGMTRTRHKINNSIERIDRLAFDFPSRKREKHFSINEETTTGPGLIELFKQQIKRGFARNISFPVSIAQTTMEHSHSDEPAVTKESKALDESSGAQEARFQTPFGYLSLVHPTESSTQPEERRLSHKVALISALVPTNVDSTNNDQSTKYNSPVNASSSLQEIANIHFDPIAKLNESLEGHENPVNKGRNSFATDVTTDVNLFVKGMRSYNLTPTDMPFGQHDQSSTESSWGSESLQLSPYQKPLQHETTENALGVHDSRTLNQTIQDNSTRITATLNQWPVKHSAVVEGDLVLGGLMMVHEREDSVTCGPVMPQGGVQALEAMLYTLDWLNKRDLVPGVKIGAHILDDCDKDTYGLEMAVDFIKGSISNIDGAEYHCNKTAVRKVISGVVGAASSVTSIQVANLLRLFRIPQVSFFSTSPELSNKMRFEYFTRTIPSDHYQVKAMVDIVLVMGWSYVSIIYEESNYGEKAYEELEKLLGKHQICIAVKEKLSKDSGVAEAYVYDNIVLKLLTKPRARGCIIFASDQEVAGVMRAVRRCNATGAFSWIGSDGWSARSLVSDGNEPEMEGTLSVQPQANPVEGFQDYFLNLTVENNKRNPWFVEFWEDHFKCRYPNASKTPYNNYTEECTTTERLTKQNTAFEDQLQFVSDAVLAFAYAFRNMHTKLCHGKPGLCDAMKPTKGIELLNYLRNVEFDGLSGDVFHFDKNGDGPARYNIIHFKQVSPGKYKWIRVGKYLEGELRLNMSEIQFRLGHPQAPESVCSLPCEVGQAKKYVEGESCCWHCFNCTQYQIRHESDEKQCVLCPRGTVPDETHSYCRDIPEEFLKPESGWAIGAMSFSSTGILMTLFVGGVFLKHNDTPIVRASGRELSYVLLTGILLCYLVTFALVLRPTDLVCSIQRFSAGFCFTVVYAALLTKTNRISRIFNAGKRSAKRPSFISPRSQLIICGMLVSVQILINAVWMVIDPAKARHHYPTREDNLLVCNSYIDASYMIAFTYPIILIVVCTLYAVLTRKIPEAFNESKHIGFTMYTTCVIWLAFVPLYFATGSHVALRITSMSVTISLSASVTIACLFTPKLYIILIHPERNVRPNMMHHKYNTTKGSVVTATNASSMLAPVTLTAVTCDQNKAVKKHVIATMDCSTQSEQFEMELKDQKNGNLPPTFITRSTQTLLNNNGKDSGNAVTSPVIKDVAVIEEKVLSSGKIGNGPLSQNEVSL